MADQGHPLYLKAAAAALEVGNVESAARMLAQVLAEEPHTAEGWFLYSFVVERWEDQVACIKNALAVNAGHQGALARREELEEQRLPATIAGGAVTVPLLEEARRAHMDQYFAQSRLEQAGDPLDDPLQCPYCGAVNPMTHVRCAKCEREIVFPQPKAESAGPYLKAATILAGTSEILGFFEIGTAALWHWYHIGGVDPRLIGSVSASLDTSFVKWLFGQVTREDLMGAPGAMLLLALGVVRIAVIVLAWFGAYNRWPWGYYAALAVSLADLVCQVVLGAAGLAGPLAALLAMAASLAAVVFLVGARPDFPAGKVRVAVAPDYRLKSADAFFKRGMRYKRAEMWALAVAHWRVAVGRAPNRPEFLRWLGVGYMHLERYDRALPALEEGRRLQPENPEFDELLSLVHDMMAEQRRKAQGNVIAPLY